VSRAVQDLLGMRDAALADLRARPDADLMADVRYGQMTGLTRLHAPESSPAIFYFRDGRLAVARLVHPDEREARELLGESAPELPSSAGKRASVRVRADRGIAVTEEDGHVVYVEVFPPTTFEDYRDRIHELPPKFVE
jgi:hypothetical protein